MKSEEAIERLRGYIDFNKENKNELINIDIPEKRIEEEISVWEVAIESIEKQVAKKLEIDGEFDLLCAGCGSVLYFKGYDGDYCPYCGQRIDWEETP